VAPESRASIEYGSKDGCGMRISSPGSKVARAIMLMISSPAVAGHDPFRRDAQLSSRWLREAPWTPPSG
jgi:hypothetical protein